MKTWKEKYEEMPQRKQTFYVGEIRVRIEVKPYPVKTKSGLSGGIMMEAMVEKNGLACIGEAVCIPTDKFDFAFGARLALEKALNVKYTVKRELWDGFDFIQSAMVTNKTKKEVWKEFLRVVK